MSEEDKKILPVEREPSINLEHTLLTPETALECLTQENDLSLPCPGVRACNNLDEYLTKSTQNMKKKIGRNLYSFSSEPFAVPLVRNFEKILRKTTDSSNSDSPHPEVKLKKPKHDLFSKLEKTDSSTGPLAVLKNRINKVVKVLTRRRRKIPYISRVLEYKGKLTLFDKHMNLYLEDVIESFKYKKDDKIIKRARHKNAILIRGDNVILVY